MDTILSNLVSNDDILKKHNSLNTTKATGCDNLPPKMIKMVTDCLTPHVTLLANRCISEATFRFPDLLKRAEIRPIVTKRVTLDE